MLRLKKSYQDGHAKKFHRQLAGLAACLLALIVFISACSADPTLTQPETTPITEQTTTLATTSAEVSESKESEMTTTTTKPETQPSESMPGLNEPPQEVQLLVAFPDLVFDRPVQLQHVSSSASADPAQSRFFVVEQGGRILTFTDPEAEASDIFLDLSAKIDQSGQEMGLLGLAFHPQYDDNGKFFVNYTRNESAGPQTVIESYQVDPANSALALSDSGQEIMSFSQPYQNHNGGHIAFGPDGYLYIASGDGGSGGDPQGNAQRLDTLLGKILRIDVDRVDSDLAYAIPEDNPFINSDDALPEIYAYGLRNPWRFSFAAADDSFWAADVGQNRIEEINVITAGGNYGWNSMEGSLCYPDGESDMSCYEPDFMLPIYEYDHSLGQSITGGYVYAGQNIPSLKGSYIYGDFISGRIWALRYERNASGSVSEVVNWLLLETELRIAAFATDIHQEIYVLDYDNGKIYRLNQ